MSLYTKVCIQWVLEGITHVCIYFDIHCTQKLLLLVQFHATSHSQAWMLIITIWIYIEVFCNMECFLAFLFSPYWKITNLVRNLQFYISCVTIFAGNGGKNTEWQDEINLKWNLQFSVLQFGSKCGMFHHKKYINLLREATRRLLTIQDARVWSDSIFHIIPSLRQMSQFLIKPSIERG